MSRVLIVGPPAAGKSTLVRAVSERLPGHARLCLDEDIMRLVHERGLRAPLCDDVIDGAVQSLLGRVGAAANVLVELPHHDYIQLVTNGVLDVHSYDFVLAMTASVNELLRRDSCRLNSVPKCYIARCFGSTEAFCAWLSFESVSWARFDTEITSPRHVVSCLQELLRAGDGGGLLELSPPGDASYSGGNLRNSVEWDCGLVQELARQYDFQTVLDVGCGTGLALDAFARLGIECWGLERNTRVLDGACAQKHRVLIADFTKQWVEYPVAFDLVWCVEVLEHIPSHCERNMLLTLTANCRKLLFMTAAGPGQPGYHHVNCQPKEYWIERMGEFRFVPLEIDALLDGLRDTGPFGMNVFKRNGLMFGRG
jgi:SAM-dependent methyltransferase